MVDDEIVFGGMAAVPIITALLQMVKPWVPIRAVPLIAVGVGVTWNVGLTVGTDEWSRTTIFLGIVVGLAASGLYSAGRVAKEGMTEHFDRFRDSIWGPQSGQSGSA